MSGNINIVIGSWGSYNKSVFVAKTRSYAKTVVTNHFYRFWFQFNASHSVLLLLSSVI